MNKLALLLLCLAQCARAATELSEGGITVRATRVSPRTFRIRYSRAGGFPELGSFAVEAARSSAAAASGGPAAAIRILRSPLRVVLLDESGGVVSEDAAPVRFDGTAFTVSKKMPDDERYFALGDKTGPLDRREEAFTLWNTDAFGWQESTDPIYKSIPFVLAMRGGSAWGLFLDDTYRSRFDFGKARRGVLEFGAEGGELDYYLIYGPDPKRVIEEFTALTGRMPLPPLFSLGYQQCRYSYYPEARVRELAAEFRKRRIPADVIYLDIDYQKDDRPFTVDRDRFPKFEGMIADLKRDGFKTVLITDLHLAKRAGYKPYDEGSRGGYFLENPDGSTYVGKVWPGESVFPDFTRSEVRRWWGGLYADFVRAGARGFWNDMNEPAIFERPDKTMPLDVAHRVEGRKTDHREIHNVYGMENARATYEGLLRLAPDVRPFVLTRAAYAGAWRYAASWTGDNSSTWNHMRLSVPQLLNLGLSGYAFVGDDIGGFSGSPTPELLTRWMELGAFNPVYRNHSMKGSRMREPWVDGPEHEAIRRRYIETRYRLLPYLYTGMEEASRTGIPLMRPMFLEFPKDPALAANGDEFMLGRSLLVAPKVWEFAGSYNVRLPAGTWYDYWTGERHAGGGDLAVDPPLDTLPVFVREGSIIPEQPVIQHVGETPKGPLKLRVYPGGDCRGELYLDDGESFAYRRGRFLRAAFSCEKKGSRIIVRLPRPEGAFRPWFDEVAVEIVGVAKLPPVAWPNAYAEVEVSAGF